MKRLSIDSIIQKIANGERFHAVAEDYSFSLKIEDYVPFVCAAIHDGHQFRPELWEKCLHTEYDRWYEEDPETKTMIAGLPIVLAGRDSRFEYDLNRSPADAIFETAWGKQLWRSPLSESEKSSSLTKHANFYKVVDALIHKIESAFGACVVYDMHSYNWKRWDREVPTWNLGTKNLNNERFGSVIELWREYLEGIELPYNIKQTAAINNTFYGNGYFLKHISGKFKHTLVLATEIAKIYCDEYKQLVFPEVVETVAFQLKHLIPKHAAEFQKTL